MQPSRIFETVLYAEDLTAAERFYHEALGLEVIERGNVAVVFRCCDAVLIIFDPRKSAAPARGVPSHGTTGVGHVAFAAKSEDLPAWREQLRLAGANAGWPSQLMGNAHVSPASVSGVAQLFR